MKKKIILTGGSGQDGIILNNLLIKKNYLIYSISNKKKPLKKFTNTVYLNTDLSNFTQINDLIEKIKPYAIIHLASKNVSSENMRSMNYRIHYEENFLMTKNIVNSIIKNNKKIKFIFSGSSQMFMKKIGIVNENSRFMSDSFYSKYKIDAHRFILKKKRKYNLNASTAILFNHDSKYRNKKFLLPRLRNHLLNNQISSIKKIYQEGIEGDFSHAEDICNGLYLLLKSNKNPDKIIFSSNKISFINNLIKYGLQKMKINIKIENKIKKKESKKLIGNNSFAKRLLKWKNKKSIYLAFEEILQKR
jgi:GDPmannose 4,6-dehydratase